MAKVVLRDDRDEFRDRPDRYMPVVASIEGDCDYDRLPEPWLIGDPGDPGQPTVPPGTTAPVLEVWLRARDGYTDEGVPKYLWQWLTTARAIVYEERREYDAQAGHTLQEVKAMITYLGPGTVDAMVGAYVEPPGVEVAEFRLHEAMAVKDVSRSQWFNVTSYRLVANRLEIQMQRVDEA